MKRKQLWKVLGTGCLAASLLMSPMTGVSALAAEGTPDSTTEGGGTPQAQADGTGTAAKTGGSKEDLDPTQTEEKPAVGDKPAKPAYADTTIDVWGWTQDATVYSVDVEWGAMTFQYENNTWDPENHVSIPGKGWQVYDSAADKVMVNADGTKVEEHAINEIKVTNHSNDKVWAALSYAGETGYTDTTGDFSFTTGTETGDTNKLTAKSGDVPAYLTLETADNGTDGAAGTPTVGKAYFMPNGIKASQEISKWTKIGTITVGIKTAQPTAP